MSKNNLLKNKFNIFSQNKHKLHKRSSKARFETTTIKNTGQYHCYKPVDDENILFCRLFSNDTVFVINVTSGKNGNNKFYLMYI